MNYSSSLIDALESIRANKLRSGLTMLGIVIGVAAVIAMVAIGTGAQTSITSQIEGIGANLLYVRSGGDASIPEPLTLDDAEAIADGSRAPSVSAVAPILEGQAQVSVPGSESNTEVTGVTADYFEVQSADVSQGQTISTSQYANGDAVALVGTEVLENLEVSSSELLGNTIRINGQVFEVIGILEEQGGTGFGSSDNRVLVPFRTAQSRLLRRDNVGEVDMIYVQASNSEVVDAATDEVARILRAQHISNLGTDDFTVQATQNILETAESVSGTLTVVLGGIAGVSLLVGGIGIMNIMLVSVIERTREIGLRKALGARKIDILAQFLVESLVLSISGGIIGVLVGWGLSFLLSGIAIFGNREFSAEVSLSSILMATLFSAAVGVFFGIYPANRAANLQPVEALRTE
jgi:putative ABC transport system permease protein